MLPHWAHPFVVVGVTLLRLFLVVVRMSRMVLCRRVMLLSRVTVRRRRLWRVPHIRTIYRMVVIRLLKLYGHRRIFHPI